MNAPQNNIWGPEFWKILHGLAEKVGSFHHTPRTYITQVKEEKRLWSVLLSSLKQSLPCPMCRKHYLEYLQHNNSSAFINIYSNDSLSKDAIRLWLYNLHTNVNQRLGKENMNIERLSEIYSHIAFNNSLNIISTHITYGIGKQWVSREEAIITLRILRQMFLFYSC